VNYGVTTPLLAKLPAVIFKPLSGVIAFSFSMVSISLADILGSLQWHQSRKSPYVNTARSTDFGDLLQSETQSTPSTLEQDVHYPAVIPYAHCNETHPTPHANAWVQPLNADEYDPSHLVTAKV